MSYSEHLIEPADVQHPDMLIMYPLPIMADINNTGSRLQAMADIVGAPVLASDLYLQKQKTIFDMSAKTANQPIGDIYRDMSQRRADFYTTIADRENATARIGMGDSHGVSAVQGMQLHGEAKPTFDAVLLRDGWNLGKPTSVLRGLYRYGRYQIKDALAHRGGEGFDIPPSQYDWAPAEPDETSPLAKLRNVADIMRGDHNRQNAIALATGKTVMNVVTFTDGLSAPNTVYLREFGNQLRDARAAQHRFDHVEGLIAKQHAGWHSDLLDPRRGADDLNRTIDLLNITTQR